MSEKSLSKALAPKYKYIKEDNGEYHLYDTTKPAKITNSGDFVACIKIDKNHYVYNDNLYSDVESLSTAIDEYISKLPFYHGYYDPGYKESWRITMCLREYIESIGFKLNNIFSNDLSYYLEGFDKEHIISFEVSVDYDQTTGRIYKNIGPSSWTEIKFDGLDEAIGAVNSFICLEGLSQITKPISVLEKLNNRRKDDYSKTEVDNNLNVYITNQKEKIIKYLESELERLKNE